MRVVDSSAWVEWLAASKTGAVVKPLLPQHDRWLAPTIIQLELAKWACRTLDERKADDVIAFSKTRIVIGLNTDIALAAATLCREHKLATADAIVYATARAHDADLLTCDAHFKGLPNVILIEKRA